VSGARLEFISRAHILAGNGGRTRAFFLLRMIVGKAYYLTKRYMKTSRGSPRGHDSVCFRLTLLFLTGGDDCDANAILGSCGGRKGSQCATT
jgi:hypothetical protein